MGIEVIRKIENSVKKHPCLIHCRFFSEDRDMDLVKINGRKFYICQSLEGEVKGGDKFCGLMYPAGLPEKERLKIVKKISKLRKRS